MKRTIFFMLVFLLARPALAQGFDIPDVNALLDAIEQSDDGVQSIQAKVQYDRHLELQNDRILRRGTLYFVVDGDRRKFAVRFDERIVDNIPRQENETLIFDGRWFVEKREDGESKVFIRREVARDGDDFDPLKLGEGPFPIPIGQRKEDILRTYTASMPAVTEGLLGADEEANLLNHVKGAYQLHLIPKNADDDLQDIRLWYIEKAGRLVPRLARTENAIGDVTYVQLIALQVNAEIPKDALSTEPPSEADGWDVQEKRLPALGVGK